MTASTSMSVFCQWLLNEPDSKTPPCAIVLHGDPASVNDSLVNEIAQYLNEYDDEADGLWLNATSELALKIAQDPSSRRLLGMKDLSSSQEAETPEEFLNTLSSLSKRGHLVFQAPTGGLDSLESCRCFHAGIGNSKNVEKRCHIIIDPQLIAMKCIPQIVADVFLEWAHCDDRDTQDIRQIR